MTTDGAAPAGTARALEIAGRMLDLLERADTSNLDEAEQRAGADAVASLRRGGAALIATATPHLREYYRSIAGDLSPQDLADYEIPAIGDADDVWQHVEFPRAPTLVPGDGLYAPATAYVMFSGWAAWEEEHGVALCFADGAELSYVGPADGHPTLAHAYADVSLLGVVFR